MSSEMCAGSFSALLFLAPSHSWLPLGSVCNSKVVSRKYLKSKIFKVKIPNTFQNFISTYINVLKSMQALCSCCFCWAFLVAACPLELFKIIWKLEHIFELFTRDFEPIFQSNLCSCGSSFLLICVALTCRRVKKNLDQCLVVKKCSKYFLRSSLNFVRVPEKK